MVEFNAVINQEYANAVAAQKQAEADVAVAKANVSTKTINLGSAKGSQWVVLSGLKSGEKVMVDGFQKLQPGATVKPIPWQPIGSRPVSASSAPVAAATVTAK